MTKVVQVLVIVLVMVASEKGETSVVKENPNSETAGLYSPEDKVVVLSKSNFNTYLFNKKHAWLIEFYNSWCGFCRRFAPVWKEFAADVSIWRDVVSIGAIDCADDGNNDICRNYEIMSYPTLKYFHENYSEEPNKFGETVDKGDTANEIKHLLMNMLQREQGSGKGKAWPNLLLQNYTSLNELREKTPTINKFVFLVFDNDDSSLSTEIILDLHTIYGVSIQRVSRSSPLAVSLQIVTFPNIVVVNSDSTTVILNPMEKSRQSLRKSVIDYLRSQKFDLSEQIESEKQVDPVDTSKNSIFDKKNVLEAGDIVYQTDLETGLRYILNNEISRKKYITGVDLEALKNILNVLIKYFPFTANGKEYVTELRRRILYTNELTGKKFAEYSDELQNTYAPVYSTLPEWHGCKGSSPNYRGFTCSIWTMFHVLTVTAAERKTTDASEVLRAMHDYVKYFFGCTDCSEHFQAMAKKNNLFSVAENDGAIIWLWVAHNEVNHRLAGDQTEDPQHPKGQFPLIENCPKCWQDKGAWNMTEVLRYLKKIYSTKNINLIGVVPHPTSPPFSKFDITIFALLHIYFAVMLVLVLRMILIKKIYKRKSYKSDALRKV